MDTQRTGAAGGEKEGTEEKDQIPAERSQTKEAREGDWSLSRSELGGHKLYGAQGKLYPSFIDNTHSNMNHLFPQFPSPNLSNT